MRSRDLLVVGLAVLGGGCRHGGSGTGQPPPAAAPADAPGPGAAVPMSPADTRPRAAAPSGPSLYERLGGVDAIRGVVGDFHARVMADARISAFFRGVDAEDLKGKLTDLICQSTGGPCVYRGRTMREAHTGMHVTDAQFDALVGDLVAALDRFNVPEREKTELLNALGGMRRDIVGH
jgi:hemoglobin